MRALASVRHHLHRLPTDTRLLLVLLAALLATTGFFAALSDEVIEKETHALDTAIVRGLREANDPTESRGPDWLPQVARDLTSLGSLSVLGVVVLGVAGFLALSRRYASMVLVVASSVLAALVSIALKAAFARPRPDFVPHLDETVTSSYPSGHAMLSAMVYVTLGALLSQLTQRPRLKAYILGIAFGLSFLVGLTRIYLGVHYPTDVIGGWSAGVAFALLSAIVARLLRRRSPSLEEESHRDASAVKAQDGA